VTLSALLTAGRPAEGPRDRVYDEPGDLLRLARLEAQEHLVGAWSFAGVRYGGPGQACLRCHEQVLADF